MELRSFNEWSKSGYKILKGEKAIARMNDGTPLFSEDQVEKTLSPRARRFIEQSQREYDAYYKAHYDDRPKDHGSPVCDDTGKEIGTRIYHKYHDKWEAHTVYPNGAGVWHCGGPCGDLYYDEFGNT
jgi:hypothetical protein